MTKNISREQAEEILESRKFHVPDDPSVISNFDDLPDDEWDLAFEAMSMANDAMNQSFWTEARLKRLKELSEGGWKISPHSPTFEEDSKIMLKSSDDAMLLKIQAMGDAAAWDTKSKAVRKFILILCAVIAVSVFVVKWEPVVFFGTLMLLYLVDRHYQNKAKNKISDLMNSEIGDQDY